MKNDDKRPPLRLVRDEEQRERDKNVQTFGLAELDDALAVMSEASRRARARHLARVMAEKAVALADALVRCDELGFPLPIDIDPELACYIAAREAWEGCK